MFAGILADAQDFACVIRSREFKAYQSCENADFHYVNLLKMCLLTHCTFPAVRLWVPKNA